METTTAPAVSKAAAPGASPALPGPGSSNLGQPGRPISAGEAPGAPIPAEAGPAGALDGGEIGAHKQALGLRALADLDPRVALTAEDLGRLLGRNPRTIQRAADRGEFPPPFKALGHHCWTVGAVLEHFARKQAEALALVCRRERRRVEAQP